MIRLPKVERADRIVAIDPGIKNLITGVVQSETERLARAGGECEKRLEKIKMSGKEWRTISGQKTREKNEELDGGLESHK